MWLSVLVSIYTAFGYPEVDRRTLPSHQKILLLDFNSLEQTSIPTEEPLFKELFGEKQKNYLNWLSGRLDLIKIQTQSGSVLGNYSRKGFPLLRAPKSIHFDPEIFKLNSLLRKSLILHEASHHDFHRHVTCRRPSRITPGLKYCDENWKSPYGLQFMFLVSHLEEMLNELSADDALIDIMSYLDRILEANSRISLVHVFQDQLMKVRPKYRDAYLDAFERYKRVRNRNSLLPDISELFKQ